MNEVLLTESGLTPGEAKVYLALLELGEATTGPITEQSGVAKSIVYHLLTKLGKKGLVSYIIKEKTKYYQAAEPSHLLEVLDKKRKDLDWILFK